MASAQSIATQILFWASRTKDEPTPITQMQLHKLLYYVQGWSLAEFDQPAFDSRIEAWQHGPVVPALRPAYKEFGPAPLEPVLDPPTDLSEQDRALVDWVMGYYGRFSASYLRNMTHREKPWLAAWGDRAENDAGQEEITLDSMRVFFREQGNLYLKRMGLTRQELDALLARARSEPLVSFDEAVGRAPRGR